MSRRKRRRAPAGLGDLLRACLAGLRPVFGRSLRLGKGLGVLEPRRHRRRGPGEHLMVVNVEQPQPALLPHGERDEAAQLDQLGLAEMPVEPVPERIIGVQVPRDCLGIRKRRLLALVVIAGLLEVQQVLDVILHDGTASGRLDRALIAAVFTLNGARYVEPAQLFDGVITHAVLEDFAPAAFHLLAHLRVHLLQRNVADSLLGHGMSPPAASAGLSKSGVSKSASLETALQGRRERDPMAAAHLAPALSAFSKGAFQRTALRSHASRRPHPATRRATGRHCGWMPAALTTRAYSWSSLRTNILNSSGDMSMVSLPRPTSRSRTAGSFSALRVSAEILFTIPAGMPAGPHSANHSGASAPLTPASPVVGTSGNWPLRFAVLTASGRTLPPLMCGIAAEIGAQ